MLLALTVVFAGAVFAEEKKPPPPPPIRALLVTGGCSHDYQIRQEILTRGIRERVVRPIEWVVRLQGVGESDVRIPLFESAEWAKDYDIVVHDHCFPRVRDTAYVDRILAPHRAGLPAVLLHGSMMSFRTGDERWFDFTGLTTRAHERERAIRVEAIAPEDPILKGFLPWEIPREELYRVEKVKSGAVALTRSLDPAGQSHITSWTHRYGPGQARVFGTSLGNATSTVADAKYLDLITRGFLWSLGELSETSFRVVPEAESLKGFVLDVPAAPLPKPGRNLAREGEVSAFSWGASAAPDAVAVTNDGDPSTAWSADTPGPGAWEVSWRSPREVEAVVVYWKGAAPREARLEGTRDGRTWDLLAKLGRPEASETPEFVRVSPSTYLGLRISIDAMPSGGRIGLREVAAYDSEASVPGALLAMQPDAPAEPKLHPAGTSGFLSRIQLAPTWRIAREGGIPLRGEIGQLIPTSSGAVFLSVFPGSGASGSVYRVSPEGETGFAVQTYLAKIESDTRIAWDGEWLYTLSGPQLERVRGALGNSPADERQRFEALYTLPAEGAPQGMKIHDLELGKDGWLWARVSSESAGLIVSRDSRKMMWPLEGMLRFSPLGRGLSSERPSVGKETEILPGGGRLVSACVRADDGGRVWLAGDDSGTVRLVCLSTESGPLQTEVDWDDMETKDLADFLSPEKDQRPSLRLEAAMETLRRKNAGDRESIVPSPGSVRIGDLASLLVTASSGPPTQAARASLERLAAHPDPSVQAAAYLAMGDLREGTDSSVFAALGSVTIPEVSVAIFDALRRSGASLPGAETVAMSLANHENAGLAAAAHDFLVDRGAFDLALQTLDREDSKFWPGAFAVLKSLPSEAVVGGLIERLEQTGDPEFRREGLETLVSIYPAKSRASRTWSGSARIANFVSRALADHRVDLPALIGAMEIHGLPEPSVDQLFALGRNDLGMEAYTIDGFITSNPVTLPDGAVPWLRVLAGDKSRDADFRRKVLALLAKHGPAAEYRLWFTETLKGLSDAPASGSSDLLRSSWLGRSDHGVNRDWLKTQIRHREARARGLAWLSLAAGLPDDGARHELKLTLGTLFADAAKAGGEDFDEVVMEIASASPDFVRGFVEMIGGNPDPVARSVAAQVAAKWSLDPINGTPIPPTARIDTASLLDDPGTGTGNAKIGAKLFRTRDCIDCHNPHGEGPGAGPDLAELLKNRSLPEVIESITGPDAEVVPAYKLKTVSPSLKADLIAWGESQNGTSTEWVDLAGNRFEVGNASVAEMEAGTPCGRLNRIPDRVDLLNLTAFLREITR